MKLPIYKCSKCKQLQGYQGKEKPHCGKCGIPLTDKDIDGYYESANN